MSYRYIRRTSDYPFFHIFNRGINKQTIFKTTNDYQRFINKMFLYIQDSTAEIVCYCLMRNHFHIIMKENEIGDISKFMQRLCTSYAMYFNLKNKRSGYVFQGPYKEKTINSDEYLLQVSAYIHNNPIEIGIHADTYQWSSYKSYLSGIDSTLLKEPILGYFTESNKVQSYQEFVTSYRDMFQGQAFNLESRPGLERVRL
ncbi:MAG: transposase [bacterium]|nr:transposase [bacterium]